MYSEIERYLSICSATGPSFSPDGRKIAYLTDVTGVPQAWILSLKDRSAIQITAFSERVGQLKYSPVSDLAAFSMDSGGNERMQIYVARDDGSGCENITGAPDAIHSFGGWSPDGSKIAFSCNRRDTRYFDVWVYDLQSRTARPVFESDDMNNVACWSADGPWRRRLREAEYGSLERDLDFLREISPIRHISNIRCPLMVVHGKNDPRVPFGEAVQIIEGLSKRGSAVESLFFEDEGHGIVKRKNKILAWTKIAEFLDKVVGPSGAPICR